MAIGQPESDLLDALLDVTPVGLGLVDDRLRFVWINRALAAINGMPRADQIGRTLEEIVPALAAEVTPNFRRVLESGEPLLDIDIRGRLRDTGPGGVERRWLVSYYPVGGAVGVMVADVTEQRRAEQALSESEERFRSIFDGALVGMDVVDEEGRFLRANKAMAEILGRPLDALHELDFHEITHPDDRERSRQAFQRLLRGEVTRYSIEKRYIRPDGETIWGRILVASVGGEAGRPRMIVSQLLDLTDTKRAEERLRRSQAQLALAQGIAHVGSWQWQVGSDEMEWSDELFRIFGFEPGAFEPTVRSFTPLVHPDDRELWLSTAPPAIERGEPYRLEGRIVQPSGAIRVVLGFAEPVRDEHGRLTGYVGTTQDVTERAHRDEARAAVARLDRSTAEGRTVPELAAEATRLVARLLDAESVSAVWLDSRGRLETLASAGPPPAGLDGAVRAAAGGDGYTSDDLVCVAIPARSDGCAAVAVAGPAQRPFPSEDVSFLRSVAQTLATGVERRRSEEQIAALASARGRLVAQTLDAEDETRRRISELLHDRSLQELLAARQDLAEASADPARAGEHAGRAREGIERAIRQLREAVADLHPVVLEHGGLASALTAIAEHNARRGGFSYEVSVDPDAAGVHDALIASLARELLHNAAEHAAASSVQVRVRSEEDGVVLEVEDDGRGFDPGRLDEAVLEGHIGLASHSERVEAVGGRLTIASSPGAGARMRAVLPGRA